MGMKLAATAEEVVKPKNKGGRPPGSGKKKALEGATAVNTSVATAGEVPQWAQALLQAWSPLEQKIDKLLAAIEPPDTPLNAALAAPVSAIPAAAAKERPAPPKPPEASLEEQGFRGVTTAEVEAMDLEALIDLSKDIGVDIGNCFKPDNQVRPGGERLIRQRILVFIGKSAELYEAGKRAK